VIAWKDGKQNFRFFCHRDSVKNTYAFLLFCDKSGVCDSCPLYKWGVRNLINGKELEIRSGVILFLFDEEDL